MTALSWFSRSGRVKRGEACYGEWLVLSRATGKALGAVSDEVDLASTGGAGRL